ncbi:MAG: exodeoxyribonuclease V subunit alpha [Rhabdochlamydiaceae bacterium]|nr:exodeoxyribonuclease V subunit alpha [Candidatus Amphrikana amoebophyrae]
MKAQLVANEILQDIDFLFASTVCRQFGEQESMPLSLFLASCMALSRKGHICFPFNKIPSLLFSQESELKSEFLTQFPSSYSLLPNTIIDSVNSRVLTNVKPALHFNGSIYLHKNWIYECQLINQLNRLKNRENVPLITQANPKFNEKQLQAFELALKEQLVIISGGPGCGKTFVAAQIIEQLMSHEKLKVAVAAPTGKAVENIRSALSSVENELFEFSTLHKLLKIKRVNIDLETPTFIDADIVIVDECSMIDLKVFTKLLSSIHPCTKLILLGDPNQLPPVEAGTIFHDLCQLDSIAHVHLDICHRVESIEVLDLAKSVIECAPTKTIDLLLNNSMKSAKFFTDESFHESRLEDYAMSFANLEYKENPAILEKTFLKHKVLCSHNLGKEGAHYINYQVAERIEALSDKPYIVHPILVTKNCPRLSIMNGSQGVWIKEQCHGNDKAIFFIDGEYITYPIELIESFDLSYAMTIHKSQGSEYENVSIILSNDLSNFGKEALYTGITRCRFSVEIYCSKETLLKTLATSSLKISQVSRP